MAVKRIKMTRRPEPDVGEVEKELEDEMQEETEESEIEEEGEDVPKWAQKLLRQAEQGKTKKDVQKVPLPPEPEPEPEPEEVEKVEDEPQEPPKRRNFLKWLL